MDEENKNTNIQDLLMHLKNPVQCHLWLKDNITPEDFDFEFVQSYEDSSHFCRSLLRCKQCGQLYYSEFYEVIDWEEGNDDIYSTYIPVDNDEQTISALNKRSPLELLGVFPSLQWDSNKPIRWVR